MAAWTSDPNRPASAMRMAVQVAEDIAAIASGRHSLDAHVRQFIHQHLSYRFVMCRDGARQLVFERQIRRGDWTAEKPLLNPLD
jgi:hypothetical protein